MSTVSIDKPQVLIGLIGLIPLIILAVYYYHRHRSFLGCFISSALLERESLIRELKLRYVFSRVFFGIFLVCIIIALAGPRWGRRIVMEYHRGLDVVLALDLSRSMDVRDITGIEEYDEAPAGTKDSRLDRAICIALDTVEASAGIRFGVAIGKARGVLAVPLTYDSESALGFLEGLSGSAVTGRGTNLETLIHAASEAFQDAFPTRRGIILFSDGESWSGSLSAAIDRVMDAGITITALGVGTETGGLVSQETAAEETRPPPVSYRREDVLRNIAERSGGIYVDGNRRDAAALLTAHIRSLSPESGTKGYHIEAQAQWRLFVIIALVSLGLSKLLEKKKRRRHHA